MILLEPPPPQHQSPLKIACPLPSREAWRDQNEEALGEGPWGEGGGGREVCPDRGWVGRGEKEESMHNNWSELDAKVRLGVVSQLLGDYFKANFKRLFLPSGGKVVSLHQNGHPEQKHTNFLTSGRWAKQHPSRNGFTAKKSDKLSLFLGCGFLLTD